MAAVAGGRIEEPSDAEDDDHTESGTNEHETGLPITRKTIRLRECAGMTPGRLRFRTVAEPVSEMDREGSDEEEQEGHPDEHRQHVPVRHDDESDSDRHKDQPAMNPESCEESRHVSQCRPRS